MDVVIPKTVREFHIELGKAILRDLFASMGTPSSEALVRRAPDADHIEAAIDWCKKHKSDLLVIAAVAERAQGQGDGGAILSLLNDLYSDLRGINGILRSVRPRYVSDMWHAGTRQSGQKFQNFLQLLQQIAA